MPDNAIVAMVNSAETRLASAGIELPPAVTPFGAYVPAVQTGTLLFLRGMLPTVGHDPKFLGRVGKELNIEQGRGAARAAALNVLAVAKAHLGSLEKISRVVRLGVYIATTGERIDLVKVADGASELLRDVFGEDKISARLVFGVESIPLGTPVESPPTIGRSGTCARPSSRARFRTVREMRRAREPSRLSPA